MGNKTGKVAIQEGGVEDIKVVAGGVNENANPEAVTWRSLDLAKHEMDLQHGARQHALDLSVQIAQTFLAYGPAVQPDSGEIVKRAEKFYDFLSGQTEVDIDKAFQPLGRPEPEDQS